MIKQSLILLTLLLLSGCSNSDDKNSVPDYMKPEIMILSISTDGNYAVTSDLYQHIVLWNLKDHTYEVVARKANVYSAYFIKNTNDFMYQSNTDNTVYVENTDGQIIKTLKPSFASYGELMTSKLQQYYASDADYNMYGIVDSKETKFYTAYRESFEGNGKLFNLTLSSDDQYLIGSSDEFVRVWYLPTMKMQELQKNDGQTFATISPDSKIILSGDLKTQFFKCAMDGTACQHFFAIPEQLPNEPENYQNCAHGITTMKFIDKTHFLVFYAGIPDCYFPFAALYDLNGKTTLIQRVDYSYYTMNPIYLPLLISNNPNAPQPLPMNDSQNAFLRDQAIDTSPSAHVLVIAQADQNGILVYKYDPATQTLKQVWAPVIEHPWWKFWDN